MREFSYKDIKIQWLGHDSFILLGKTKNIYFDPYQLKKRTYPKADIIISSHEHMDHCHPESINIISDEKTVLIGPKVCQNIFKNDIPIKGEVKELNPYEKLVIDNVTITAIPAYNSHRFRSPGNPFHPKEANHIGPVVEIDGIKIYHAGDADHIPEMKELNVDIAFLPVSGKYVMDVEECVQAANDIKAKIIIPMHVGRGIGNLESMQELKEKLPDRKVIILDLIS